MEAPPPGVIGVLRETDNMESLGGQEMKKEQSKAIKEGMEPGRSGVRRVAGKPK